MYTSTNKSATMTIPVGTDVITSLGNKTTFSRLSNGDVIKMIVETDHPLQAAPCRPLRARHTVA